MAAPRSDVVLQGDAAPMPMPTVVVNTGNAAEQGKSWWRQWLLPLAAAAAVGVLVLAWMARGGSRSCSKSLVTSAARYATTATQNKSSVLGLRDVARARGMLEAVSAMGGADTGVDVPSFSAWLEKKEAEFIKASAPPEVRKAPFSAAAGWR